MALVSLMLVACFSFALSTAVQLYLIDLADESSPGSKDFASTLMPVASNLGIAIGCCALSWITSVLNCAVVFAIGAFAVTSRCHQLDQEQLDLTLTSAKAS